MMKTIKNLFVGLLFAVFLAGCGSSGGNGGGQDAGSGTLVVTNKGSSYTSIWYVYISRSSTSSWGNDQLTGTISPGYSEGWEIYDCNDYYDIKVVYSDGTTRYNEGEYLSCGYTATIVYTDY